MKKMREVAEMMEDKKRMENGQPSLLDLNLVDPTTGRDVVMGSTQLSRNALNSASPLSQEQRTEAWKQLTTVIWPHILKRLVKGGYDVKRKDKKGWTALTLLTSRWVLDKGSAPCLLAECLLKLGANVNERNPEYGGTPLIMQACVEKLKSVCGLQLLLRYGADVNQQSNNGDTFIHWLVRAQNLPVLRQLYMESQNHMMAIDYTVKNHDQETAIQLAERACTEAESDEEELTLKEMWMLLQIQHDLWKQQVPPYIHSLLQHSILLPDLASIVTSYITG